MSIVFLLTVVQNERNVSPVALGGHMSTITLTNPPAHQSRSGRSTPRSPSANGKHSSQGSASSFTATAVPPSADLYGVGVLLECLRALSFRVGF